MNLLDQRDQALLDDSLVAAAERADLTALREALNLGAHPNHTLNHLTALHWSAQSGLLQAVKWLAPLTQPDLQDASGWTPLHFAARFGHSQSLSVLLPYSNARAVCNNAWTALHYAAQYGHESCASLLLPVSNLGAVDSLGIRIIWLIFFWNVALHH